VSLVPEKRLRPRVGTPTIEEVARRLYDLNPDVHTHSEDGRVDSMKRPHWTAARSYNSSQWRLAMRQATNLVDNLERPPYELIHRFRSEMMFDRLQGIGDTRLIEDIDRAIQGCIERLRDETGIQADVEKDDHWARVEPLVLDHLDVNEGLYWGPVTR
jgi:hypothetical protein